MNYEQLINYCNENNYEAHGRIVWVSDVRVSKNGNFVRNYRAKKMALIHHKAINQRLSKGMYFLQLSGKNGKFIEKYISIQDRRSSKKDSLHIYFSEEEAKEKLKEQLQEVQEQLKLNKEEKLKEIEKSKEMYNEIQQELEKLS